MSGFIGKDEHNGQVSLDRPDAKKSSWSLEAIAATERPHDLAVSPDGSRVAFILDRDLSDVWVMPVVGGIPIRLTTHRELTPFWEDTTPSWSPDGSTIAYANDESIWVVPAAGGRPRELCEAGSPMWLDDETLLVSVEDDDKTRLATVEVADPWPRPITPAGQNVYGASVVPGGRAVTYLVRPDDDPNATHIWWADLATGETRRVTGVPAMQDRWPAVSPDGKTLVFTSERNGWYHLYLRDLETGEERQVTEGPGDIAWVEWHSDGRRIVATRSERGRSHLVLVDTADGAVTTLGEGGTWSEPHWAGDGIVATYEDHRTPPRLVRVSTAGEVTVLLDNPPAEIQVSGYVSFEEVTYPSFDGLEIHGFLFKPKDAEGRKVPAVVYPHGGPTDAYGDCWDPHAQYFVAKGYAWFAINFRGSTTYGRDFERANHGVWGVADTRDCLAAYDYLASLDWIDPTRVAIYGASYGSYMSLCSLAFDPEHRFRCGVAEFGDSNIATSWAHGDRPGREDLERMMGRPAEAREAYTAGSPIHKVADIAVPIFVAHGEKDVRVHPNQSERLVEDLKRHDKTFEYVTYPTEGHGFLRREPQIHFHKRLERFLDWHLM